MSRVLITAGASGIGRAMAEAFAASGAQVWVTDIDENHLFYLKSRGIRERKARAMLVKAFIWEIVEELEDEMLIEALEERFETWLDNHG